MATYKDNDNKFEGRKTNIEDEALKLQLETLRKHLTLVFRCGDPKTIYEAKSMVEKAEERFAFSDDSSEEEEPKVKKTGVKWRRNFTRNIQTIKK